MLTDLRERSRVKTTIQRRLLFIYGDFILTKLLLLLLYCNLICIYFWQTLGSKSALNKSPMEHKTIRREASWLEGNEERDVVSPWDVPLEIRRILGLESREKEQV